MALRERSLFFLSRLTSAEFFLLWLLSVFLGGVVFLASIYPPGIFERNYYIFHATLALVVLIVLLFVYQAQLANKADSILFFFTVGYAVFHFGMVPVYLGVSDSLESVGFNVFAWYENVQLIVAAYSIALTFLIGLVSSVILPVNRGESASEYVAADGRRVSYGVLAQLGLVFSVLAWFLVVLFVGFQPYDLLLQALEQRGLGALIGLIHTAIGICFVLAVSSAVRLSFGIAVFFLWSAIAFVLGFRGEVAFPVLLAAGVLCVQGRMQLSLWKMVLTALVFLGLSSVVAVFRISTAQDGLLGAMSIARGLAELGGSIRPAYEVAGWIAGGDNFQLGATYFAPFERVFLRFFPIAERVPAELDFRLMNVLIANRAGPYGFSIAAEAYFNYGYFGCVGLGLVVGYFLRALGSVIEAGKLPLFLLLFVFAFFIHIRQSFVTSFGAFFSGCVVLCVIWCFATFLPVCRE